MVSGTRSNFVMEKIYPRRLIYKIVNMLLKVAMMINPFNQLKKINKYFKKRMKSGRFLKNQSI
jgi:hypothetical protein